MRLIKYLFLLAILFSVLPTTAQYTNVHYIAPSPWSYFNRYNELVITTTSSTPVAVTIAGSDGTVYSNSLTTVAGTPLRYRFSALDATANYAGVVLSGQGLKISASVPIGVQVRNIASDNYTVNGQVQGAGNNCVQKGNSAFTSLGDQGKGTAFRLGYYANVSGITCYANETGAPLYEAMAINNNTNVYLNGSLLTTLNAGQAYMFQAAIGSLVTSSDLIVMNTGMRADNTSGCGDGVQSQIIPTSNLGTTYVVVRSTGLSGYERSTIVATQANTTVTVNVPATNSTTTYTLASAGSYITINNGDGSNAYSSCYITSNNPVAVFSGSASGCEIDMIVQPPLNNCAGSFDVQTNNFISNAQDNNSVLPYFGYVIVQSDTAIVYFNGTNLESLVGKRTQIGKTGYYIITYTNAQLNYPTSLRFTVNARINVALIESGGGYSMSAFISSISNPMPPPIASSNCLPTTFTAQSGFNSYQWYKDSVAIPGATAQTYVPTVSGLYSVTGNNQNCGTSAISTAVPVNPKPNAGVDQVVCNNSIITLTGTNPTTDTWIAQASNPAGATLSNTTNGIATVALTNAAVGTFNFIYSAGCADTVAVLVKATSKSVTTASICAGNSYTFNGKTYTTSIVDTIHLTNSVGCDSAAIINLTVKPTSSSTTTASICAGSSYLFNGTSYTTSGTYTKHFTNSVGCDSAANLVLTVNPTSSSTTTASICTGGSYTFNGTTYTSAGTYIAHLTNSVGCDSAATLVLTVKATSSSTTTASICAGNTYTFNGVSYSNSGTYLAHLTNAVGCDSAATLILSIKATSSSTTNASIVSGNSYTFNGVNYTIPGTYTVHLTNSVGCDSAATLILSVTSLSSTNASICSGSTYTFNGVSYATTGVYTAHLKNIYGFDSTATLNLTVKNTSSSTTNASICSGGSYTFNGVQYTSAGTYTNHFTNSVGCDSSAILVLTVKAASSSTTTASICNGNTYTFNGNTYSTSGTYVVHLTNKAGCDSAAILILTVKQPTSSTTVASICSNSSYSFNGTNYTTSGSYTVHLTNSVGCDSAATLILTVKPTSSSTTTASICAGSSYSFNGTNYTTSGTYTYHFTNSVGCDSTVILVLTVNSNPTIAPITGVSAICVGTNTTYASTTAGGVWSASNSGTVASINASTGLITPFGSGVSTITYAVTNAFGCTSQVTKSLTVNPVPSVAAISGASSTCVGSTTLLTDASYGGTWATSNSSIATVGSDGTVTGISAGNVLINYTLATSTCGTTVSKTFTTVAPSASTSALSICANALPYVWNGVTFSVAGTQTAHLTNYVGCDSAATLNLTVKPTSTSTTNISICPSALPYSWNGLTFSAAGTQTAHLTNYVGCDSAATLVLTVKATSASTTNASICAGGSYTFNGTVYTTAGTYTKTLVNAVGCDSIATLNLTVKPVSTSTTNISICPSALPYTWNGITFTAAGTQTAHLTNYVGCDSAATLNLTVKPTSTSTTNISICPSALPYTWNGLTFSAAGTQTAHLTNYVGCDSAATLNLTVKPVSTSTTNISICPSALPYTWNGLTFSAAGTQTAHLTNYVGCDSAATLNLTVKPTSTSTTNISICPSALPYTWNGLTFTAAGTQTAHLTNYVGCDSAATLNLTVKPTSTSTTNISICPSALPYTWNGLTFTAAGTQTAHLTNYVGCDSAATLVLTVKATSASTTNASICAGGSYTFNGTVYTTAGTYTKTLVNAVGCDSIATLNLTVKPVSTSTTNISICPSALPYTWNGLMFTTAGTQTAHLTNYAGCDSAATLVLTVKATSASTTNASICAGGSYTFNGTVYTTAGTYTKTLVNAVGCDSIATLNLTVKPTSTSTTNISICPSALPYTWNGLTFSTTGTQTAHLINYVGCDSAATLNLTVKPTSTSTTNISICPSALPYTWNGLTFTAAGTQTAHLTNYVGCDSAATLVLTVKATSASTTNASICAGGSYTFNGTVYTTAGTYTKTLVNAVGCDSIATLNLTVKPVSTSTTNISICPSALPYTWNGLMFSAAGTQTAHLINYVGCDSAATLVLTVKATSASTTNASICAGGSYTFNGTVYTTAGTYTKTLVNAVGCDSIATLNLTVKPVSTSTTNISICPSALPYNWNGLTFGAAGTQTAHLINYVGCDSSATLNLTVKPTSTSTTNISICPSALPYTWNGLTFSAAGTQTAHLTNYFGCDSAATLVLTVKATSASTTNASICAGGSYTFNGAVYTAAGTYSKTLVNAVGCDSIATLNLTVKPTSTSTTNISICPSALPYTWNGLTFSTAGTQTAHLTNYVGCDSAATLNLTVKPTSTSTTNISICPSALPYTWNGLTFTAAGTQTAHLTNYVGCDSAATLNLTVKPTSASNINISICPSALPYTWNGLTFSAAGIQTAHLTNYVGCDSAATLVLTVKATSASTTTAILCAGNTYQFNGVTYNTPGTYVAHLTNYIGCDSVATLVLVGGTATTSTTSISICPSALPYTWNGLTFTTAGSQTAHLTNASGCDSAATLVLTVKAALTSTTNATICGGNSYLFNGITYTTSGTYNAYLASGLGCDSIATLVLTVLPKPNAGVDKIVGYNNGNASVTLSGVGSGVWLANTTNIGSSVIVDPTNATTAITNFSTIGTYEYLYINGACSDTMKVSVLPNGNISSYVWVDTNEDGINNESTTNGINNVTIELYQEDTNGNYVLAQTTTTATYNGRPGYYNFVIPENGNYKVKFPLVAQGGALTTQNLSANGNNNSVADTTTGFSPVISINTTGSGLSLNNTTIGAGYKYVPSPNCNMTATIGVNQLSQCVTNNQYQFTGNFTGGTAPFTYLWDLNDSNTADTRDVTHTYATSGEHDVTFIVKDSRGCEAHASTMQIYIGAKPKASFDIYTHSGNGDGFTFVSTSTISGGWMNYSWNLGNGTTSTLINPMTTYTPGTYTVTLVVTGNFGCSDTITKVITVDSSNNYCTAPIANFSVNNSAQCLSGNNFALTNLSTGDSNAYTWNFGDGAVASNNFNEQHIFTNTGTYNISLTATNTCGTNTVTKTISVNGTPATLTAITGPTSVALGGVIGLSNSTNGGVWASANSAVATINNYGIVTGIAVGNTVITYTVPNTCGTNSISMPITVLAANSNCITPLANFTINANTQCLGGNNFIFSNSASGTGLTYTWNFDDGAIGNSANGSHAFTQAGVYNVKLIVSNACGTDSIVKNITVIAAPLQPQAITGNNSIAIGGTTTLSSTTTGGVWSSSSTAIATVSANGLVTGIASGTATITYTVTNACGTASVSKIVLVSQPCVPTNSTTTASICAGNSYTFNGTTYTNAGTYVAHLTNAAGCDSVVTLILTVKQPTSSTTTASICAGNSYIFNGTTYTTGGTYVAHLTNAAGCDSAATLILTVKQPTSSTTTVSICAGGAYTFNGNAYSTAGTYVVHLTNAAGCDSVATLILTVKQPTSSVTSASICAGKSYSFNGNIYTNAGTYIAHLINLAGCDSTATLVLTVNSLPLTLPSISGNTNLSAGTTSVLNNSVVGGTWSSSNTAIATINVSTGLVTGISAGTTLITYTVTDACGNIVSTTTNVTVAPASIPCTVQASFSVNNQQQCITDNQFVFTNTTTGGIAPYTYLWQISEGSTATTKDFTKAFATYGEHDVNLKVIDANGCESNATAKHVVIGAKPVANFTVLSNTGNGTSKTFISASTLAAGSMSYMWDLGNGTTSTLVNPTVTYSQGTYTVKLVVSGIGTCKDSVSQVINEVGMANVSVYPNPVINTVQVSYRAASTTATTIKLLDLNGRVIQTQTVLPISVGTNLTAMFDFRNLQPGSYLIQVSDAQNGALGSKIILKQ
ncbi:PKD domain-containing protein [Parasediminibacterium paludis]|uniref:PKD domain-containing protein n=1 Tax=Parasediminibacterium paludis TaxID=908966 RepID=A0ABV8PW39_9BACT